MDYDNSIHVFKSYFILRVSVDIILVELYPEGASRYSVSQLLLPIVHDINM